MYAKKLRPSALPTSQQIENTRMAYAIMAGFPAKKIELSTVRRDAATDEELLTECGSSGCVAGVLSAHPFFNAQGFHWTGYSLTLDGLHGGGNLCSQEKALFGSSYIFDGGPAGLDGKRTALRRIRQHLVSYNAITQARSDELEAEERKMKG